MGDDSDKKIAIHGEKIGQLEKRMDKIDILLEKVSNRPPLWTSTLITILAAIVASFIGWAMKG